VRSGPGARCAQKTRGARELLGAYDAVPDEENISWRMIPRPELLMAIETLRRGGVLFELE
jgi:hypothetical protein